MDSSTVENPAPPTDRPSRRRDLSGLRVVVLGSTSGIGRATALELAGSGADVVVHGNRSEDAARAVVQECRRSRRGRSEALLADLTDRAAGDWLVGESWGLWGGLDAWIHFAGADTLTGSNAGLDFDAKLELLWRTDVVPTIRLCRAVGRRMQSAGSGSIVTMGWDGACSGMEGDSGELFAAAKGAVMSFTRSLSLSLAPTVRVNGVAPGWIKTSWGENASESWQQRVLRETPLARWGRPEDVARVAAWLAAPDSDYVTGQILKVNGGAVR